MMMMMVRQHSSDEDVASTSALDPFSPRPRSPVRRAPSATLPALKVSEAPRQCCDDKTCRCLVPRLVPVTMEPQQASGVAVALSVLSQIERIQVRDTVERNGATYFVMDVYLRPTTSRLPLPSSTLRARLRRRTSESSATPDYQVSARFSDFAALRADVSALMCMNSRFTCEYCNAFEEYILFRIRQPRWIVKIGTRTETRKTILESFINDFVKMAQLRVPTCQKCLSRDRVPFLIEEFVHRPSTPALVRPSTDAPAAA
ncbi:hypothetical protein Poli38472_002638 [Pythium oligandrum]|uniref:PX domain-containing protein n=1 Tax=Pythium oligandrum TaxID=41045 RepID=A0A8K1CHW2_PYTOL|nr:hypothetical protein Poli38472_002638 [Pythium oligandrum]|eukprot:TMW63697.1 hypothetical protein Poli38472_002638 [Pythium oligandrum]